MRTIYKRCDGKKIGNINGVVKKICFQKVETIKASADSKTVIVQKIWELKIYKEPSVPIRARRKMQWPALGGPWPVKASNQPFRSLKKKLCALSEMDRFKGKGGE